MPFKGLCLTEPYFAFGETLKNNWLARGYLRGKKEVPASHWNTRSVPETWGFSEGGAHTVQWTWISLVPGLASASGEDKRWARQLPGLLAICVVHPYLEFSARVIPKLHFHMHITSLVSSEG